jgi:hypothetical protein
MSFISVDNFVSVSVSTPPVGLNQYQVNNLAIFSKETPVNGSITQANPGIYTSPADVAADWGSLSEAYDQAVAIFNQTPNILDGSGILVIYPQGSSQTLTAAIQDCITRAFFGGALWCGYAPDDAAILDAGAACESLRVKLFANSYLTSTLTTTTGLFWKVQDQTLNHTRCLLYTVGGTALAARLMAAAYAGRALSTNFNGVNTTSTMHGKSLIGTTADTGITQTILNTCKTLGVDTYPLVGGGAQYLGKVFCTGGNEYFDNVYNLDWLVFALQVAGFNALTQIGTKIPQTETGMASLKNAYLQTLQQGITNAFIAPGVWNSPELFGSPVALRRSVLNTGYYMYSQPINQQSQVSREAREAPLVQIAVKYAGAIQSSNVLVSINK